MFGFVGEMAIFTIMAAFQPRLRSTPMLFVFLYACTFFFDDCGPNTTTFGKCVAPPLPSFFLPTTTMHTFSCCYLLVLTIMLTLPIKPPLPLLLLPPLYFHHHSTSVIPAEVFPTEARSTCHGISAAAGKVRAQFLLTHIHFSYLTSCAAAMFMTLFHHHCH